MAERVALPSFIAALLVLVFASGFAVARHEVFPHRIIREAGLTLSTFVGRLVARLPASVQLLGTAENDRQRFAATKDELSESLLVYGGMHQFPELCPEWGCLAVEFARSGEVLHAYPYRPLKIHAANAAENYPHESIAFDFTAQMIPFSSAKYENGDLLVVFHSKYMFPFAAGVARVDQDGHPRWFRFDYSHHWPTILPDGRALVPAMTIGEAPIDVDLREDKTIRLPCASGRPHMDIIQLLDGEGKLRGAWSVLDAVTESPYRGVLQHTTDGCDPLHLNYVQVIGDEAAAATADVEAGDVLVSLRNISAFGFLDRSDGRLKRLVRGTFFQQHSVQHWRDATFLIFDNHGGDADGGPSRLLSLDLASGEARTIFPTAGHAPRFHELFSDRAGKVDISPDRERALVTFSNIGKAFEVRLVDGAVLTEFHNVHDVSSIGTLPKQFRGKAGVFALYGMDYGDREHPPGPAERVAHSWSAHNPPRPSGL